MVAKFELRGVIWLYLVMIGLLGLVGCGSNETSVYPVSGEVVFPDGKPLSGGCVELRSIDAERRLNARGFIRDDGSFELSTFELGDGAIEGEHQVMVRPPLPKGDMDDLINRGPLEAIIDTRFQKYASSGLRFNVTADGSQNHLHIEVQRPSR